MILNSKTYQSLRKIHVFPHSYPVRIQKSMLHTAFSMENHFSIMENIQNFKNIKKSTSAALLLIQQHCHHKLLFSKPRGICTHKE